MTHEPDCAVDREIPPAANLCAGFSGGVRTSNPDSRWTRVATGPLDAIYARVRDRDLGEVRHWVTVNTLSRPAAAFPAARLPSRIRELSLLAVRTQVELRASEVGPQGSPLMH